MRVIRKGIRVDLRHNGIMAIVYQDILNVSSEDAHVMGYEGQLIDEMSGQVLDQKLVVQARRGDMAKSFSQNAYDKVPTEEAWRVTGKNTNCLSVDRD